MVIFLNSMKPNLKKLKRYAIEASKKSYSPYSNYAVGACLQTKTGQFFKGSNIESANFVCACAEQTAIYNALIHGQNSFVAICVYTQNGATPCGKCRQLLKEFCNDLIVICLDAKGKNTQYLLSKLLPKSFEAEHLKSLT